MGEDPFYSLVITGTMHMQSSNRYIVDNDIVF